MPSPAASPAPVNAPATRLAAAETQVLEGAITLGLGALDRLAADPDARAQLDRTDEVRMLALLVECRLARGDMSEAMDLGDELSALRAEPDQSVLSVALAHYAQGEIAAALGDPELAATHYLAAGRAIQDGPGSAESIQPPWRAGKALVLVRANRAREASVRATEHHAAAVRDGSPYVVAHALRVLAATQAGAQRVDLLREARALLEPVHAERLAAQIDADLAGLLMLTPTPEAVAEAVQLLRRTEIYAGQQELWPLQGRVRRMLDRLGEAPLRVTSEALALLTVTERRVAGLAATGLTNRQIAEELLVSIKAVEWHLSRTYRKLGISSRSGLTPIFGIPA
ncbi:hypothetical protein NPS01_36160 [Nocardioides psychrotolerans]|uniref:Regulatory protein, luxR family n=1 Tax=Nocardioides psychrotolerans TaxID=1005945 RepID=A0A1I3G9S5_9ACTN|nr:LuxR family transcriptional regulator [Nocardioides psychrotolerans]GEP39953.1 hypothetical protein NPS01_36160 [Nocardioides psychrotolerans]SFI19941.1 regulatory protein, luxR family [Nocardioides psychrotolerans]